MQISVICRSSNISDRPLVFEILRVDCFYSLLIVGHTKSVEVVVYSPDSSKLCSGSWDRTAILWDVEVLYSLMHS